MSTNEPFDAATRSQADGVIEHVNGHHADSVLYVARHLARTAGAEEPTDAEIVAADPHGIDLQVRTPHGSAKHRIALDLPATSVHDLQSAFIARLQDARAAAPDEPPTSLEVQLSVTAIVPTRHGALVSRRSLTPNVIEITVGDLTDLTMLGGDEYSYVLVTTDLSPFPPGWTMDDYRERGDDNPIIGAYYTTRRARPAQGELDIWVVLHDHPAGVAAELDRAHPGRQVVVWGPRRSFSIPSDAGSVILVADESGAAAVAALIESAPPTTFVTAVVEVVDSDHELPLPSHPRLSVRWIHRGTDTPGGDNNRLLEGARRAVEDTRPDAAFGAAESRQISAVRRFLRHEVGLAYDRVLMTGYWRREID